MDTTTTGSASPASGPVTADAYKEALLRVRDRHKLRGTPYLEMLRAQYAAPGHTLTARALARATQPPFESSTSAALAYGKLGRLLAEELAFTPPMRAGKRGKPVWWASIATGPEGADDSEDTFAWTLRAELVEALRALKWVK